VQSDKAIRDKALKGGTVKLGEDFWNDFLRLSLAYVQYRPEATIYDIFNFMREQNGGASFSEGFLEMIDAEVEAEYKKDLAHGRPSRY
jgi:hypothetical protein